MAAQVMIGRKRFKRASFIAIYNCKKLKKDVLTVKKQEGSCLSTLYSRSDFWYESLSLGPCPTSHHNNSV